MMKLTSDNLESRDPLLFMRGMRAERGAGVLVVDDDRAIRETLCYALEDDDYIVRDASDGLAALEILRASRRPLVVLLDLMMPRLDGVGVLRAVAEDRHLATFHAYIIVSANTYALTPTLASLVARTHAEILRKPFDLDVLLDRVEHAARRLTAARGDAGMGHSPAGPPLLH
ncbi:MAG: response regulator [Ktedonobacterales bacterium]|nr:response regulator [Ktedonobacterales bacterium]